MNYPEYKSWLGGIQPSRTENVESDMRVKKFVVDAIGGDDILRKMMMLSFISNGILDKNLADTYILRGLYAR